MPHYCDVEGLDPYCETDKQRRALEAVRSSPTIKAAADSIGISERNLYEQIRRIRQRAAEKGFTPHVPNGHIVSGVSTLVRDGEAIVQWVKTRADAEEQRKLIEEARQAMIESLPREKPVSIKSKNQDDSLLNLYVITDYHIGMKAWGEETGADWDTRIAEDLLASWFSAAIRMAPNAGTAVLAQLGDFLHWDGIEAVTPAHRHLLDADTRFQKLVRVAIRSTRRIVRELLKKHERVHLILAEGNHDPAGSMWLRELFAAWYEDEPRVTVDQSPDPYYCYEFGLTSLFFHHGHKRKMDKVDDVFVAKFREVFGRTRYSYGHMGHLHHNKVLETNLMHVEQHQTLAAPDAYASSNGWMSGRSAKVVTYSKEHGEVGRITLTPEMLH
jgi:hypothetical protein